MKKVLNQHVVLKLIFELGLFNLSMYVFVRFEMFTIYNICKVYGVTLRRNRVEKTGYSDHKCRFNSYVEEKFGKFEQKNVRLVSLTILENDI